MLPFITRLLHVILLSNVAGFRRFSASTDQWKCKIFIFHAAAIATLLRKIVRNMHHGEPRRRRLNLWRLMMIHYFTIMVRRCLRCGALRRN